MWNQTSTQMMRRNTSASSLYSIVVLPANSPCGHWNESSVKDNNWLLFMDKMWIGNYWLKVHIPPSNTIISTPKANSSLNFVFACNCTTPWRSTVRLEPVFSFLEDLNILLKLHSKLKVTIIRNSLSLFLYFHPLRKLKKILGNHYNILKWKRPNLNY